MSHTAVFEAEDTLLQQPHDGVEQIGQHDAPDKGRHDIVDAHKKGTDGRHIVEQHIKQHGAQRNDDIGMVRRVISRPILFFMARYLP